MQRLLVKYTMQKDQEAVEVVADKESDFLPFVGQKILIDPVQKDENVTFTTGVVNRVEFLETVDGRLTAIIQLRSIKTITRKFPGY